MNIDTDKSLSHLHGLKRHEYNIIQFHHNSEWLVATDDTMDADTDELAVFLYHNSTSLAIKLCSDCIARPGIN